MDLSAGDMVYLEEKIRGLGPKSVLLQVPEGMKTSALGIAGKIRSFGPVCIIWADPCYGACDIPENAAKALGCDLIVHAGHASFMSGGRIKTIYLESRADTDFSPIVESSISKIPHKKVALLATVQYIGEIPKVKDILEGAGKEVLVGKSPRLKYAGQVLGCDAGAALDVEDAAECFLLLSGGMFHALGVLKRVRKPVFLADADTSKVSALLEEKRLIDKKSAIRSAKLKDAKNIGILVSTKAGQIFRNAHLLQKKLESRGKVAWIIAMDYISPEKILGMKLDALVNTACPRIEDDLVFPVPVIDKGDI